MTGSTGPAIRSVARERHPEINEAVGGGRQQAQERRRHTAMGTEPTSDSDCGSTVLKTDR